MNRSLNFPAIISIVILSFLSIAIISCSDSSTSGEAIPRMIVELPDDLSFNAPYGGPSPDEFLIYVSSSNGDSIGISFSNNESWISLQNPFFTGYTPDSILVVLRVAAPVKLLPGIYYDTITVTGTNAANPIERFEIQMTIGDELMTTPDSISFIANLEGNNPEDQYFKIQSTSGSTMDYIAEVNSSWLSISKTSGITSNTDSITISADVSSLPAGTHYDTVWISADSALNSPIAMQAKVTISSWLPQQSPLTHDINQIYFIDDNNGWIVGRITDLSSFSGFILKTTNGGNNWAIERVLSATTGSDSTLGDIQFIDNIGWISGARGIVMKSTDIGQSWDLLDLPDSITDNGTSNFKAHYFITADTGWFVGENGKIVKTEDGGLTWIEQNSTTIQDLQDVYFVDSQNGWAVGNIKVVLHTTDGGATWTLQSVPNSTIVGQNYDFRSVWFVDNSNGFVCGKLGQIIRTSDGGSNWTNISFPKLLNFNKMQFANSTTGWIVGQEGIIYKTTDGGDTWEEKLSGTDNWLFTLFFLNANNGWIAGENGVIKFSASGGE